MKRKIYDKISAWKNQWNGRTALLINGARRIGKSWIAEEFARNEYKSYILIDFNNVDSAVADLFNESLTDLDSFFSQLSIFTNTRLYERESVIIFDEVQLCPRARAAIKYLVKDGRFDFIETGSLVSINQNVKGIVIPSEEIRIEMYPMDFEEFLWATDQELLSEKIKSDFMAKKPLGANPHRKAMEALRAYILVGGMPQAVLAYLERKDFREVDAVKRSIIDLYRNDIIKYAGKQAPKVTAVFNNIPGALQNHGQRFRPSQIKKEGRMRDFVDAFFWLNESRVANFCYATTEPSVGMALNLDDSKVKIYMADTGLLVSMAFSEMQLEEGVYEKILRNKLEFNKGMLVENLVAQMLKSSGHPLFFFESYSKENVDDRMEIDFLISKRIITTRHNISPIEVKSGSRYATASLNKFNRKFSNYLSESYVFHTKDFEQKDGVTYLPLYMAGNLGNV